MATEGCQTVPLPETNTKNVKQTEEPSIVASAISSLSVSDTSSANAPKPASSASTSSSSSANNAGKPSFPTIVFSRKTTYHGPHEEDNEEQVPASLSSVVHQTDRHGNSINTNNYKQTSWSGKDPTNDSEGINSPQPKGIQRFFTNVYSALGLAVSSTEPSEANSQIVTTSNERSNVANAPQGKGPLTSSGSSPCMVKASAAESTIEAKQADNFIIPRIAFECQNRKCLVLDLDETLVHSSFKPISTPDYILPVEIEGHIHRVYVSKRPNVDIFLAEMGKLFEIVVYTASLNKYADPLLDLLDVEKVVRHRLFRQHCVFHEGNYVKDLSLLGRELSQTIIIDNSPLAYLFHPQNAIGCTSYIDDPKDNELLTIMDFLRETENAKDVRVPLQSWTPHVPSGGNIKWLSRRSR